MNTFNERTHMKDRSVRGLTALAGSAFITLALLASHVDAVSNVAAEGAADTSVAIAETEDLVVPQVVDAGLPLPVAAAGASATRSPETMSAGSANATVAPVLGIPNAEPVDGAPRSAEAEPPAAVADSGSFTNPQAAADPAPPAMFHPVVPIPGSTLIVREETAGFTVRFTCSSADAIPVTKCVLVDRNGVERRSGETVYESEGLHEWVGTAVTASGQHYRTVVSFTVIRSDRSGPVITSDWDLDDAEWTNVASGTASAVDPESGVESITLVVEEGEWVTSASDHLEFSLPDGVYNYYFRSVNRDSTTGYSQLKVRKIDTVKPSISVGTFGVVGVDGRAEIVRGASVRLDYSCADERSGVASCSSTLGSSGLLDTSSVGEHIASVTAVDQAGNRTEREVRYVVLSDPEPQDDNPEQPADGPDPQDDADDDPTEEPASPGDDDAPVVTDDGDQRPAVAAAGRGLVGGATGADSLAATGADTWQIATGALIALVLVSAGGIMLSRRRTTE